MERRTLKGSMKVTKYNNFCRVFELPISYPTGYCFGNERGRPVTLMMVDWFNPWPPDENNIFKLADKTWSEVAEGIKDFLSQKPYIKPGRKYLVVTDFGESLIFETPLVQAGLEVMSDERYMEAITKIGKAIGKRYDGKSVDAIERMTRAVAQTVCNRTIVGNIGDDKENIYMSLADSDVQKIIRDIESGKFD